VLLTQLRLYGMTSLGGGSPLWREGGGDLGLNADPALVVKEFARTRRNRMILADGRSRPWIPSHSASRFGSRGPWSWFGNLRPDTWPGLLRIFRSRKRERENLESFPAIAGALQEIELGPKIGRVCSDTTRSLVAGS